MSNLFRILSFVPPMFLFIFSAYAQLSGTIEQDPISSAYTVSVIPSVTWAPPLSITNSAAITLRAPSGKLQVSDFQGLNGNWNSTGVFNAPAEAPDYDYFIFTLSNPLVNVTYNSGVKFPLFSFKNSLGCAPVEIIGANDPFTEPNSMNISISNYYIVLAYAGNAYAGNTVASFIGCPPLAIAATATTNPVPCYGDATSITVALSGGKEPYNISWVNNLGGFDNLVINDFEGQATIDNLPAGTYTFTVLDAFDSTKVTSLAVMQPSSPLSIEMQSFDAACDGSQDGVAQLKKAHGGTVSGSYQYSWEGFPTATDSILENVNPGVYSVTVTDDNGCTATGSTSVGSFTVIFPNPIIKDIVCFGDENGIIDLYPLSINPPFTFKWSSNVTTGDFSSAWQLGAGSYTVTITDASGCKEVASYSISEPPAIEVDYRLTAPKCFGDKGALEILGISNANEPWTAAIQGGESVVVGNSFELEPGNPMRLTIEDAKGCLANEDFIVAAKQEMHLELGENRSIKFGENINFDLVYFPFDNVTLSWTPTFNLSCADCPDPIASPTEEITYRVQLTDTAGCTMDDFVNVSVRKSRDIFIPNSFSPNHDGINDAFYPFGGFEIVAIHSMKVFDRWGGKMFESEEKFLPNDANSGWDGLAKDKLADPGTYLYTMSVEFIDGEIIMFSGEVNLMK